MTRSETSTDRIAYGEHDRIRIGKVAYTCVGTDERGHRLRRADDPSLVEAFSHAEMERIERSPGYRYDKDWFKEGKVKARERNGVEALHEIPEREQAKVLWKWEYCDAFRRMKLRGETCCTNEGMDGIPCPIPWLDAIPFHAAAKSCEMIGAVRLFGRRLDDRLMTDADWYRAGNEGFEVAAGGVESINAFLKDTCRSHDRGRAQGNGPNARFGSLYAWLAHGNVDPGFDVLRDAMVRSLVDNVPFAHRQNVFAKVPSERKVHSLRSASLQTGIRPARLRSILSFTGHLACGSERLADHETTFDAAAAADLLRRLRHAHDGVGLATALNANRVQAKILVETGFIEPVVDGTVSQVGPGLYATEDVDAFLAALKRDACPVPLAPTGTHRIPDAARRACCHAHEVVELLLRRRLTWVGRLEGIRGYEAVLVDVDEVRRQVRGPEMDGVTLRVACKLLRTNWRTMDALVEHGVILTTMQRHPANRVPVPFVTHDELRRFAEAYESLIEAARELGVHHVWLRRFLSDRNIEPELTRGRFYASFYRREHLADVVGELSEAMRGRNGASNARAQPIQHGQVSV